MNFPITLPYQTGATPVPAGSPLEAWIIESLDADDNIPFDHPRDRYHGTLRGLALTHDFFDAADPEKNLEITIWGPRALSDAREGGYQMEGRVSIGGVKARAFTSSTMFELADGRLVKAGTLFVCLP